MALNRKSLLTSDVEQALTRRIWWKQYSGLSGPTISISICFFTHSALGAWGIGLIKCRTSTENYFSFELDLNKSFDYLGRKFYIGYLFHISTVREVDFASNWVYRDTYSLLHYVPSVAWIALFSSKDEYKEKNRFH